MGDGCQLRQIFRLSGGEPVTTVVWSERSHITIMQTLTNAPDLRTGFPRSPNASLGFYVILPRIIDKCRALIAGTNGEYNYNCPLDQGFFNFAQVDAEQFKQQIAAGKSDEELLAWVRSNSAQHSEAEIKAWSYAARWRRPEGTDTIAFFETLRMAAVPDNYSLETWFQLLDAEEGRL
ncbi:MAG: hypothetical protein K0Q50_2245 [Vampirovibrio sp.]|nr:hypothetical protein [Vampirovibrio sp.]